MFFWLPCFPLRNLCSDSNSLNGRTFQNASFSLEAFQGFNLILGCRSFMLFVYTLFFFYKWWCLILIVNSVGSGITWKTHLWVCLGYVSREEWLRGGKDPPWEQVASPSRWPRYKEVQEETALPVLASGKVRECVCHCRHHGCSYCPPLMSDWGPFRFPVWPGCQRFPRNPPGFQHQTGAPEDPAL